MCGPERFALRDPAQQRERGVGQIVERKNQRGDELLVPGELQQAPAEQEADRQTADIAEENPGDRAVEGRKAEHRTAKCGCDDCRRRRQFAEPPSEQHQGRRHRHNLSNRHEVQSVHEVHQVHEPEAGEQKHGALDANGQAEMIRKSSGADDEDRNRYPLKEQSRQGRDRLDVVDKPMMAMKSVAPKTASGIFTPARPAKVIRVAATTSVAAITAMPAPWGVGMRCDDRALGLASAMRINIGRVACVMKADINAARIAATSDRNISEWFILSV